MVGGASWWFRFIQDNTLEAFRTGPKAVAVVVHCKRHIQHIRRYLTKPPILQLPDIPVKPVIVYLVLIDRIVFNDAGLPALPPCYQVILFYPEQLAFDFGKRREKLVILAMVIKCFCNTFKRKVFQCFP